MINLLGGGLLPPTFYTRSRDLGPSDPWSLTKNLNYETVDNSVRKTTTTTFPPNAEFFLPETPNFWRPGSNTIKLFLPQLNCHKITSRFWFIVWDLQWVFKWAWDLNLRLQETNDGKCDQFTALLWNHKLWLVQTCLVTFKNPLKMWIFVWELTAA